MAELKYIDVEDLVLNEPGSNDYIYFCGDAREIMPKLKEEGFVPLSISDIMRRRLEVIDTRYDALKSSLWFNQFSNGDGIIMFPDGGAITVTDSEDLRNLNLESKLLTSKELQDQIVGDGLICPSSLLEGAKIHLTKPEVDQYMGQSYSSAEQVSSNPFWRVLARDKDLLYKYSNLNFVFTKQLYETQNGMAIVAQEHYNIPVLKMLYLEGINNESKLDTMHLTHNVHQIIGCKPVVRDTLRNITY